MKKVIVNNRFKISVSISLNELIGFFVDSNTINQNLEKRRPLDCLNNNISNNFHAIGNLLFLSELPVHE